MLIGESTAAELEKRLRDGSLQIDLGIVRVAFKSESESLLEGMQAVYRAFPLEESQPFCDIRVAVKPGRGLRRWLNPQARLVVDGTQPFEPFAAHNALPLVEWGVNFCVAQRANRYLLLHAGAVARGDRAIILAALPGSGKSTLTAALTLSGFRLFSDEFGIVRPSDLVLMPLVKPVALKNQSIDVIAQFHTEAVIGPRCPGTRKGTVAHLPPRPESIAARHAPAYPAAIIFPRYQAESPTVLEPQSKGLAFRRLAFNSFNYALLGPVGFRTVSSLVERCPAYALTFSDLHGAVTALGSLLGGERGFDSVR